MIQESSMLNTIKQILELQTPNSELRTPVGHAYAIEPGAKFNATVPGRPCTKRLVTFSGVRAIVFPFRRTNNRVAFRRMASKGSAACKRTRSARQPGARTQPPG